MRYAILNGKKVQVVELDEWATWFENADRRVAKNKLNGGIEVSTVFLGINHAFGGKPRWFETMVFGGEHDGYCERYETWDEAETGHKRIVEMVKSNGQS